MNTVYNYWHPKSAAPEDIADGFHFELPLVFIGLRERQESGVEPNPYELARRIDPRFHRDLNTLEQLLEQGRPQPDTDAQDES